MTDDRKTEIQKNPSLFVARTCTLHLRWTLVFYIRSPSSNEGWTSLCSTLHTAQVSCDISWPKCQIFLFRSSFACMYTALDPKFFDTLPATFVHQTLILSQEKSVKYLSSLPKDWSFIRWWVCVWPIQREFDFEEFGFLSCRLKPGREHQTEFQWQRCRLLRSSWRLCRFRFLCRMIENTWGISDVLLRLLTLFGCQWLWAMRGVFAAESCCQIQFLGCRIGKSHVGLRERKSSRKCGCSLENNMAALERAQHSEELRKCKNHRNIYTKNLRMWV